jgi:hypothetical protein
MRHEKDKKKNFKNIENIKEEIIFKDAVELLNLGDWHKVESEILKVEEKGLIFKRFWINGKVEKPSADSFDIPTKNQCYRADYFETEPEKGKVRLSGREIQITLIDFSKHLTGEYFILPQGKAKNIS